MRLLLTDCIKKYAALTVLKFPPIVCVQAARGLPAGGTAHLSLSVAKRQKLDASGEDAGHATLLAAAMAASVGPKTALKATDDVFDDLATPLNSARGLPAGQEGAIPAHPVAEAAAAAEPATPMTARSLDVFDSLVTPRDVQQLQGPAGLRSVRTRQPSRLGQQQGLSQPGTPAGDADIFDSVVTPMVAGGGEAAGRDFHQPSQLEAAPGAAPADGGDSSGGSAAAAMVATAAVAGVGAGALAAGLARHAPEQENEAAATSPVEGKVQQRRQPGFKVNAVALMEDDWVSGKGAQGGGCHPCRVCCAMGLAGGGRETPRPA